MALQTSNEGTPLVPPGEVWTRDRVVILALNSFNVFMWTVFYTIIIPLLPLYAKTYGFREFEQGVVLASLQVGWFIGLPLVNSSLLKPRAMVYVGAVAYVLAPALIFFQPSLWTLIIGRVIQGIGSCLLSVLMTSAMVREIPEDLRGFAFGLRSFFSLTGLLVGPVVGGFLYPYGGLRLPMLMLMIFGILGLVAHIIFLPDRWFVSYEARLAAADEKGITMAARFAEVLQEALLCWLSLVQFMSWAFTGLLFMAAPQYMANELSLSSIMVSVFWLGCDLTKMVGSLIGGVLSDRISSWEVLFVCLALQHLVALGLVWITLGGRAASHPAFFAALAFIFGANSIVGPSFMKTVTSVESSLSRGNCGRGEGPGKGQQPSAERFEEVLSLMDIMCSVGLIAGPLYAGARYEVAGFAMTLLPFLIVSASLLTASAYGTRSARAMKVPKAPDCPGA